MSDDPAKFILGDTAISAIEQEPGRRRFFGRRRREKPPLSHCENCGAELAGRYCSQCGQPAIDYRRSFRHVIVDVLDSFLNWDSKFFATIGLLIARPWQLTNEFIAGKRVRYLHPLRLYLLASILFFFAVTYGAKSLHFAKDLSPKARAEIQTDLDKENLAPEIRAKIDKALQDASPTPKTAETPVETKASKESGAAKEKPKQATPAESEKPLILFGPEKPNNGFEKWLEDRAKEKIGEHGTNAQLFFVSMISNLPYMMLCSIPLFALVLKVLYIRNGIFYIDHLIYALHIHTFAYVATMLIGLITVGLNRAMPGTLAGWIIGLFWFAFTVQIFLSIRRVYRQGWIKSFIKFWLGGVIYLVILVAAFAATFLITLAVP
ncbi:MAG: hypothetical protein JWO45_272 [Spartobacteria bacterium]|nr:hypothetical protein [Spartobacteria bacterium]